MFKKSAIYILLSLFSFAAYSQTLEIEDGTVFTCGGVFYDDNGGVDDAAGTIGNDYSQTSYTYTICPDNPGDGIAVDFVGFSVTQNPNPNNSDVLLIFNGDSSGAPLMGSSNAINFSGITFAANTDNPTGCLTFVFNQNSINPVSGGWQANVACITPCSTPYAEGTITSHSVSAENGIQACIGEEITFEDVASAPGAGFTLANYIWDFGDGTSSVGPAEIDHVYTEPGEYIVTLLVEDNNGCTSTNITPFQVLVSTLPIFSTDFSEEVCLGGIGYIDGNPVQSETWTALPPQVVSGETYLADGVGFQFESTLNFNFFEEDQVLESCDDLNAININLEHSYIGDLDIIINCPDGTEVILLDYPNGGGGGYLGEPIDVGGDLTPGLGYDYAWTTDASNGTFGEEAIGNTPLPEGNYSAEGDLCDLVGCPLNGSWILTIVDNLASDDGTIFEWGIDLNPELFPGVTTFTPTIGLGLDSTWVEGPNIITESEDGNFLEIETPALGDYDYTVFASNNFGCTFDTTITVSVVNGPVVDAGLDITICNDPVQLEALIVSNEFDAGPCFFTLELVNVGDFGFGNSGVDVFFDDVFFQNVSTAAEDAEFEIEVPSGANMTLEYVFSTWGDEGEGNSVLLYNDAGELLFESEMGPDEGEIFNETVVCAGEGQLQWEWTPSVDLSNPVIPNPLASNSEYIEYTVSVYPQGFEGCISTDVVVVAPDPAGDPGISANAIVCFEEGEIELVNLLNGTPVEGGTWTNESNEIIDGIQNSSELASGIYTYTVGANECELSSQLTINFTEALALEVSEDLIICQETETLVEVISYSGGLGIESFTWSSNDQVISTDDTYVSTPNESVEYCLTIMDLCPNESVTECVIIDVEPTPIIELFSSEPMGCEPFDIYFENQTDTSSYVTTDWFVEGAFQESNKTTEQTFNTPGVFDLTMTLESDLGCVYDTTYPNYITIFPSPDPVISWSPFTATIPESEVEFTNLTEGIITSYSWVFDTLNVLGTSTLENPTFEFPRTIGGEYPTSLTVTDINGCTGTETYLIEIFDPLNIYIPNAFTPNNDGINDVLSIKGTDIDPERFKIWIFNRIGEEVYYSEDVEKIWDASVNGGDYYVPGGVYTYRVDYYSLKTTQRFEKTGFITVVR